MNFGHFDDVNKEYVITTPDTPLPWINYLGSQDFFTLISNTCGGYSFYKDAKLLRITRYRYNNIPVDSNGKYYYINCLLYTSFIIGRIILLKVFHSFEPSILAASIISRESVLSIYCFIKKTTVGAAMVGMINGTYVSISFRSSMKR